MPELTDLAAALAIAVTVGAAFFAFEILVTKIVRSILTDNSWHDGGNGPGR